MKAEHRKELATNALADRLGRGIDRVQHQNRRTLLLVILGGLVTLLAVFLIFRYFHTRSTDSTQRWILLEDGSRGLVDALGKEHGETNPGKAARFQRAWFLYWERGIKLLGSDSKGAMNSLEAAASEYSRLAEECSGDPVWEPEALYALATIEETKALQNRDRLETASKLYSELITKHEKSAHAQQAKKWLEKYEDPKQKQELANFYQEMQNRLRIAEPFAPRLKDVFPK